MKDQDICIVSDRIRKRRKQLGLTQAALAEMLDVNTKTIVTIEQMAVPTFATDRFINLCTILDCSPDYLMGIDDLPHRVSTDIHEATGLDGDAIKFLRMFNEYAKSLEEAGVKKDNQFALDRAVDYKLIIDFISFFITNMDFDIMVRHIKSVARINVIEDLSIKFDEKVDDGKIEAALKNKTQEDQMFLIELVKEAEALTDSKVSNNDAADATAFRFSISATEVLDAFSAEHLPIARKLVEREVDRNEKR